MGKNIDSLKKLVEPDLFFQTILYSGKEIETFVSTRKRLYENQTYKNISRLIPDTHSTDEHLKRVDLQTFIWRKCTENIIEYPDPIVKVWHHPRKVCVHFGIVVNSFYHQLQTKVKTSKQEQLYSINKKKCRMLYNIVLINETFLFLHL